MFGFSKQVRYEQITIAAVRLALAVFCVSVAALGQTPENKLTPTVVQPGAPGQTTKVLPASTRAQLPPFSQKDIEFMQGMIMHHAQAVEMAAMIEPNTSNKEVALMGARISQSQSDEIAFMNRWLELRGKSTEMSPAAHDSHGGHSHSGHSMKMPGMLNSEQMKALKTAKGQQFDRLFLEGMIQHHEGALVMVKDLFDAPGAGQDAELFNFASDVDSGQRAEIKTMQNLLGGKNVYK